MKKSDMRNTGMLIVLLLLAQISALFFVTETATAGGNAPFVYGEGTFFQITDSPYLNVTLTSSEVICVFIQSGPGMLLFAIKRSCSAASTVLTLEGFEAGKSLYRYQDGRLIENFNVDPTGKYVYTQDIQAIHTISIQEEETTIHIEADGSVNPPSAPISVAGNVYTLTADIYESIDIYKSGIVIEGGGHTLQGPGGQSGLGVYASNVVVTNIKIKAWYYGVWASDLATSLEIYKSEVHSCGSIGIALIYPAPNIKITRNTLKDNRYGVAVAAEAGGATIVGNDFIDQKFAGIILFYYSNNNVIYHNNLVNNVGFYNAEEDLCGVNFWDDGYPSGGNYWSDYTGYDSNHDGIGDTPYAIPDTVYGGVGGYDYYPLMSPWGQVDTSVQIGGKDYPVTIASDTTVDQVVATKNSLHFQSSGTSGGTGHMNVIFPMVNTTEIKVYVDGVKLVPPLYPIFNSNGTHYFIHFEFTLSTHMVEIMFAPIAAGVNVDPDVLNLNSNGQWVTAYIILPEEYNPRDIALETVCICEIHAAWAEIQGNVYMVKFSRTALKTYASDPDFPNVFENIAWEKATDFYDLPLTITGKLVNGTPFAGSDIIVVIKK